MPDAESAPSTSSPDSGNAPRSRFSRVSSRALVVLQTAVFAGVILHLTIRDAIPGVAVLYYALPRIVLAALALSVSLAMAFRRRRGPAFAWLAVAAAIAGWWHHVEWRSGADPTAQGITVMYWNTGRGAGGWEAIMEQIADRQPDLVALGETDHPSNEFRALWRRRFPQYDISFLGGGMMCLVRGTSSDARVSKLDGYTQIRELDVTIRGTDLRCLIIDVYAFPLYDRRAALSGIAQLAEQSAARPLLVLGDFNTPVESVHLADLRRAHTNTFEQAGDGYAATWPTIAPVLSLDQIWTNANIEVLDCRHGRTSSSDHRPVLATVRGVRKSGISE